jgi:hypothetical protein
MVGSSPDSDFYSVLVARTLTGPSGETVALEKAEKHAGVWRNSFGGVPDVSAPLLNLQDSLTTLRGLCHRACDGRDNLDSFDFAARNGSMQYLKLMIIGSL